MIEKSPQIIQQPVQSSSQKKVYTEQFISTADEITLTFGKSKIYQESNQIEIQKEFEIQNQLQSVVPERK